MKKLLIVSHCILNTASKVAMDEKELAEEYEVKGRLMRLVIEQNVQLLQLPCPEFIMYGSKRWGHVKNQFMHPHFRNECRKMLEPILLQVEEYLTYPEEFEIVGIVSVEGSPSCGHRLTCVGEWGGELAGDDTELLETRDTCRMAEEPGVLMQILEEELQRRTMDVSIMSMEKAIEVLSQVK